jgi:class 3 adenylate cyclase
MDAPETRLARTPQGYIGYQVIGTGDRDLVFVSEWAQNIDVMWEQPAIAGYLEGLTTLGRLVCFDKRGHGISDHPIGGRPATLDDNMDDLRTVLDEIGSERAVIIGDGLSGAVAALFAATYPDRSAALVLQDAYARFLREADYPWGLPADRLPRMLSAFERSFGTGATLDVLAPSSAGDEAFRAWYARYQRLSARPTTMVEGLGGHVIRNDVRAVLPSIRVPTLVLHRVEDRFVRVEHGRYLADHIPGAVYRELPGDAHLYFAGDYRELLDEITEFLTGVREAPASDRMLATMMFTDIVSSTDRAVEVGDHAWRDLLTAHNAVVRTQLDRFRGREVNTTGDGFLAVFDSPGRAVECARTIASMMADLGLRVRAGIHTGECERMGNDVTGIAVDLAARITAVAEPDEILVSSTVRDLVAGSGLQFDDRGLRSMKGLPDDYRIFAVRG